jgi:hypothetical protein
MIYTHVHDGLLDGLLSDFDSPSPHFNAPFVFLTKVVNGLIDCAYCCVSRVNILYAHTHKNLRLIYDWGKSIDFFVGNMIAGNI